MIYMKIRAINILSIWQHSKLKMIYVSFHPNIETNRSKKMLLKAGIIVVFEDDNDNEDAVSLFSLALSSSTSIDEVLEKLLFPSPPVSIMVGDCVDITIIGFGFGVGENVVVAVVTELDMVVGDVVLLFVSAVDGISVFIITIVGFVVGRFVALLFPRVYQPMMMMV